MIFILVSFAIVAVFISPFAFAVAGFRRAWRGAAVVLVLLATYTVFEVLRPMPAGFDEQDRMGAASWQLILTILLIGSALGFAAGFAISLLRTRYLRNATK